MDVSLSSILEATISNDKGQLQNAQRYLEQAATKNLPFFLLELSKELVDQSKSGIVRMAAGLQLKNYLTSKDDTLKTDFQQRWLSAGDQIRLQVKSNILQTLGTEQFHPSSAAQVIAAIACAELPVGQWPDLISSLVGFITVTTSDENLKEASLEALGYICEEISPQIISGQANTILTAIIQGMRREELSNSVRLSACRALLNSLDFTKANFDTEQERHVIMQVICEATQSQDIRVRVAALQNLVKVMSLYYHYMEQYMAPALFAITIDAMKSESEDISLQGIEFWSTVCDEEDSLSYEIDEASRQGRSPSRVSKHYVRGALQYLVPILQELMTRQEEVDDDDEWNPCKAAGVCIMLMANVAENDIVDKVMPFIDANIKSEDWRYREAAVMCLGSILDGPDEETLTNIVKQALAIIIVLLSDSMIPVRDTAAWTIGRMCEELPEVVIQHSALQNLLHALLIGLSSVSRVATNTCWAFISLSEAAFNIALLGDEDDPESYALSEVYEELVSKLLECTERNETAVSNLKSAAYETLIEVVRYCAKDCYETIGKTTLHILEKLQHSIHSNFSVTDKSNLNSTQSYLCATLQSLLRKLNKNDILKLSDTIMQSLLYILQTSAVDNGSIQEDVILTVGTLIEVLHSDFSKYMDSFKPCLLAGLQNYREYHVCIASVGVVGDLSRALGEDLLLYCDDLIKFLLAGLTEVSLFRDAKPHIISALGDIALAIGPNFKNYIETVLQLLSQASQLEVDRKDFTLVEYLNELRDSCLDAYTGVIQGLKGPHPVEVNQEVQLVWPHVPFILAFIDYIGKDPVHTDSNICSCCGILGDLSISFGNNMTQLLKDKPGIEKVLIDGRNSETPKTKLYANWATNSFRKINQP